MPNIFDLDWDSDQDGTPDVTDPDDDGDGTPDSRERDTDDDQIEDGRDTDDDNDNVNDVVDRDPDGDGDVDNRTNPDTDNDGTPNRSDTDDDSDGTPDSSDRDSNGDEIPETEQQTRIPTDRLPPRIKPYQPRVLVPAGWLSSEGQSVAATVNCRVTRTNVFRPAGDIEPLTCRVFYVRGASVLLVRGYASTPVQVTWRAGASGDAKPVEVMRRAVIF